MVIAIFLICIQVDIGGTDMIPSLGKAVVVGKSLA